MGSICASVDNVEVLVTRRDHGGNVGAAVCRYHGGTGVSTIVHLHSPSAASDIERFEANFNSKTVRYRQEPLACLDTRGLHHSAVS